MVATTLQEHGYMAIRAAFGLINSCMFKDYEPVVRAGQFILSHCKLPSLYSGYSQYLDGLDIKRSLFHLTFNSPITFAAFESHLDSLLFWVNLGCGGGCIKTIKFMPESGNPKPRLQRLTLDGDEHLLNALGLPGPGVYEFIQKLRQHSIQHAACPLGFSIGGHNLEEYKKSVDVILESGIQLLKQPYIELNISCPNTATGQTLHDNLNDLQAILRHIRNKNPHIVIVIKVSPDADNHNICDIASLAGSIPFVTLNAGNTQFKPLADVGLSKQKISVGGGGLSGPRLFKRTLEMAKLLAPFHLPIIATGGVTTASQVEALLACHVAVVGMATQLVKNPFSIVKMNRFLGKKTIVST